ncbi:hypothetical protein [Nonomuraea sp. NPDC049141]|uniref:hypothetical protein n=1 Tax=Nonomuraea sp. NPDC049141 TaxID=3155500 RepID=UPI0033D2AAE4
MLSESLQKLIDAKVAIPRRFSEYESVRPRQPLESGDRWYMGHIYYVWNDDLADAELFDLAGPWGGSDYSGDDVTESNHRSLIRDCPKSFIDLYGGHSSYGLAILPDFDDDDLADELLALARGERTYYDADDNSKLIDERAEEAWDSYLRMDLRSEIGKYTGAAICMDDTEQLFWKLLCEHEIYPEAEGHRGVTFPGIDEPEFLADMARAAIADGGLDGWLLYDLTPEGYEIVGAWMAEDIQLVHPNQLPLFELV